MRVWWVAVVAVVAVASGGCSSTSDTLVIYTSVTQETVEAVVAGFEARNPDAVVDVYRAPTGELAARIAAEQRAGTPEADILWLTDPLSMYQYAADGLLQEWSPQNADALAPELRTPAFWATRVLHLVIVTGSGNPFGLVDWPGLVSRSLAVAIPDPRFAGSAFAALGYFGLAPGYGIEFFASLEEAGAVQVPAPGDVVTGVAEGRYDAGLTLEYSARTAVEKGSPIEVVWPTSGAIAVTSPIGVVSSERDLVTAEAFVEFVLSDDGQQLIGETGWTPVLESVPGPRPPAPVVYPDWQAIFDRQAALLADYAAIFGG